MYRAANGRVLHLNAGCQTGRRIRSKVEVSTAQAFASMGTPQQMHVCPACQERLSKAAAEIGGALEQVGSTIASAFNEFAEKVTGITSSKPKLRVVK